MTRNESILKDMKTLRAAAAGLAFLLLAAACGAPASRIRKNQEKFASYPPEIQARIKAGEVDVGFTADMVRMALGNPARKTMHTTAASTQEVWSYGDLGARPGLGLSIGAGSYGGSSVLGGGVAVGGDGPYRDRAVIVFEGGKVVSIEKVKK